MSGRFPLRLLAFDSLDSTNDEVRRRAGDAPEGFAVSANAQTKGRGRRGRTWDSPPGNLYCSILLRPHCDPGRAATLSFVAALALHDAAAPLLDEPGRLHFKWPNDVLLDGKKLAGILLESEIRGERVDWVIIGAGLNVAHYPADTEFPATSLAAGGCEADVHDLMDSYFDRLRDWYGRWGADGFAPVRAAWLDRAEGLGKTAEIRLGHETLSGRFAALDADGALILETEGGRRRITAGDVFFPESARD